MCKIFVVEYHDQVLKLWQEQGLTSLDVLHLDFHCDLRGLLIDRDQQHAYRIWDRHPDLDEGNFLTHAVISGIVTGIRWVHDIPGGREYDLKSVKYKSDLTAWVHRLVFGLRSESGIPIRYEVVPETNWGGMHRGELLDIDWDFFASKEYPVDSIEERVARFFSKSFEYPPERIYVCYSPEYAHPTRELFRSFVNDLANRFHGHVVDVPSTCRSSPDASQGENRAKSALYVTARDIYHRLGLTLRKRGIY